MISPPRQIVLFTDFGSSGPYVGQVKSVLYSKAPQAVVIDLLNDVPVYSPVNAGYLLSAYRTVFPRGSVFLTVVDPGVGTATRQPVVVAGGGHWFVGPDNGLFDMLARHSNAVSKREILWRPKTQTSSFHGRDLFAPVAARLGAGDLPEDWLGEAQPFRIKDDRADLDEIIYVDPFGNLVTGRRSRAIDKSVVISIASHRISYANTFGEVAPGTPFWYTNSNGLLEIAVNQGHAAELLGLGVGDGFTFN